MGREIASQQRLEEAFRHPLVQWHPKKCPKILIFEILEGAKDLDASSLPAEIQLRASLNPKLFLDTYRNHRWL